MNTKHKVAAVLLTTVFSLGFIHSASAETQTPEQKAEWLKKHPRRAEERQMAKLNGGHITKKEKKVLNQQENQISQQIGQ